MSYLVVWYGDRPSQSLWYVVRLEQPLRWAPLIAFVIGGVAPSAILAMRERLGGAAALRWAAGLILLGVAVYDAWQFGPGMGEGERIAAVPALGGMACSASPSREKWPTGPGADRTTAELRPSPARTPAIAHELQPRPVLRGWRFEAEEADMAKETKAQQETVERVMHEFKHHELKAATASW